MLIEFKYSQDFWLNKISYWLFLKKFNFFKFKIWNVALFFLFKIKLEVRKEKKYLEFEEFKNFFINFKSVSVIFAIY